MSRPQILTDYDQYTNEWYLVHPPESTVSGNGLRYTGEKIIALVRHNALNEEERQQLITAYSSCELEPGLVMRTPDNAFGLEGPDDTVAALTAGFYLKNGFPQRFLHRGRTKLANRVTQVGLNPKKALHSKLLFYVLKTLCFGKGVTYNYNNLSPGGFNVSSWMGRQTQLIAHARFATGGEDPPSGFQKLYWCISLLWSTRADKLNWDAWVLSLHMVKVAKGQSWICDLARKYWIKKFKEKCPRGAAEVVWPNHASGRWLEGEFGE